MRFRGVMEDLPRFVPPMLASAFPALAVLAEHLSGRRAMLDGEIVCVDEKGYPDFSAVRARMAAGTCTRPAGRTSAFAVS